MIDAESEAQGIPAGTDLAKIEVFLRSLGLKGELDFDSDSFAINGAPNLASWVVTSDGADRTGSVVAGTIVEATVIAPVTMVPDVTGLLSSEAYTKLQSMGLRTPSTIKLSVSEPLPEDFRADIAYLQDSYWSANEAEALTEKLGDPADWPVDTQSLEAGGLASLDETVVLSVAWPIISLPKIVGLPVSAAATVLHAAGFSTNLATGGSGIVRSQTPDAGAKLPAGAIVTAEIGHDVTFAVTSSAGSGSVTWAAPGSYSIQQANGTGLPWSKTWDRASAPGAYDRGNFNAQMDAWNGWITCAIIVDGRVVEENTSTGTFAAVSCG